jgi:hypothetical protein
MRRTTAGRRALCWGAFSLALAGCRLHASSVPLGGVREVAAPPSKTDGKAGGPAAVAAATTREDEQAAERADVAEVTPPPPSEPAKDAAKPLTAAAAAFVVKPYGAHQAWTRQFDLEFALKVGPGGAIDMKMVSHQEARFEVLAVANGSIDKLQIEYTAYKSTMTLMGTTQDSPEELAGKRFVITFARGVPEVRDANGGKPPKKQVDSVRDDAREPLEIEKALKELAQLAANGGGDFSSAGAVSLAGGEDEDTKVSSAKARLRQLTSSSHHDKLALIDLGYTLTNAVDDKATIEAQVSGTLSVLDAPSRYQTSTLQGPMEIRSSDPGGMQGRGTVKITTSYKY